MKNESQNDLDMKKKRKNGILKMAQYGRRREIKASEESGLTVTIYNYMKCYIKSATAIHCCVFCILINHNDCCIFFSL